MWISNNQLNNFLRTGKIPIYWNFLNVFNLNANYKLRIMNMRTLDNNPYSFLRVWKPDNFFDDLNSNNLIAAIDYQTKDDFAKIEYLNVKNNNVVLSRILVDFVKNNSNKNKIILDIHQSLNRYEYAKNLGFLLNNKTCSDNPYWKETERNY